MPRRLLLFELADEVYGLPLTAVAEVVFMAELSQPVGRPAMLLGFLTVGGEAVPVVDLRRLFNLPELSPSRYSPLLLLRGERLALLVDRVHSHVTLPDTAAAPDERYTVNGCVEGHLTVGSLAVHLVAVDRLLLARERGFLLELQAQEQARLESLPASG